jgi:uroporphyrinogen-III synthase
VFYGPPIRLLGPADPDRASERLRALLPADYVILTSARAVQEAVRLVSPARLNAGAIVVPGPGTAATARRLGLVAVRHPEHAGTSEALLDLPEFQRVSGSRIALLAAAGGRRHLGEELMRRGARVDRVHVYRRRPRPLESELVRELRAADPVVTLISSGAALDGLNRQLPEDLRRRLRRWPLVVPSCRVAGQAEALGCRNVVQADGADDDAMIESLKHPAVRAGLR